MKCPECVAEGKKSKVFEGCGSSTLMYCRPFYDEEGQRHYHDSNRTTMQMSCSNGHQWDLTFSPTPCWCGWPNKTKETE